MRKKLMRYFMGLIMCMVLCLTLKTDMASAESGGFHVSGTKLYDANGNEFIMRGVNYPHVSLSQGYF